MADNLDENWQSIQDDESIDSEDIDEHSEEKEAGPQAKTKNVTRKEKKKQQNKKKFTSKLSKRQRKPLQASDLITALTAHYHNKLSTVEMDEIILDEDNFGNCNDLSHTANSYLKYILPHWKRMVKGVNGKHGSPILLIVCSSGLRAVELIREIADFKAGGCKVAKLFAKHLKLADQLKFLQKSVVHIAVGTPKRIHQILDQDTASLHLDNIKYILFDWSHSDVKQRRLVDIPETRTDMMELLRKHLIPHVKNWTETKLVLY